MQQATDITDYLIGVFEWWDQAEWFRRGYADFCSRIRHSLLGRATDPSQRKAIWELATLIEDRISVFRARGFERRDGGLVPLYARDQMKAAKVCTSAFAALAVYWGDSGLIQSHCDTLTGHSENWAAFSRALTENRLKGWKDWRTAKEPFLWIKHVTYTNTVNEKEADESDALPLEEVAETPGDAILERRYTFRSISELEAAAKDDPEMSEYIAAKIRYPDWNRADLWRQLGWDARRGEAADRRFRRLRERVKNIGAGIEWRTVPVIPGTAGSVTTYFETLHDGAMGAEAGVWQHMDALPPEPLPIAPFQPDPFPLRGFNFQRG